MISTIASLVAAERGWRAICAGDDDEDRELKRIVAWALIDELKAAGVMITVH